MNFFEILLFSLKALHLRRRNIFVVTEQLFRMSDCYDIRYQVIYQQKMYFYNIISTDIYHNF